MTPAGSLLLLLAASPVLIFAAHAVAYRALERAGAKPTAHSSAFVALIGTFVPVCVAAWLLGAIAPGGPGASLCTLAYVAGVYGALGILYIDVVNIAETSLHMHLLLELAWSGGVREAEILDRYSPERMIAARLERLTSIGQLRVVNGRCYIANRSALYLAGALDAWRIVIGIPVAAADAADALAAPEDGAMTRTIGTDFDNTIVTYDELMYRAAVARGLIADDGDRRKRSVRDRTRQLPDGEIEWQKLQALVYGPLMRDAQLVDGVEEFMRRCRAAGIAIAIVSHKTEYANYDETHTNLRTAALDWMTAHRFFEPGGLDLDRGGVFFESTRAEKISRIDAIGCTDFIDDLDEVFLEPSFPPGVQKILYAPHLAASSAAGATVIRSWRDLCDHVFDRSS